MSKNKKYQWHIVYTYANRYVSGTGSRALYTKKPTLSAKAINRLSTEMKDEYGMLSIVITNIIPLPMIHPEYSNPCK